MSIFTTIKNFFKPTVKEVAQKPQYLVVFDGDQVSSKVLKQFKTAKTDNIQHIWVQSSKLKAKALDDMDVRIAPKFGKESADTLIALIACAEAFTNTNLKEIHIVSGDGDTLDMCVSLAVQCPHIDFYTVHIGTRQLKKETRSFLKHVPSNCKFVTIKGN